MIGALARKEARRILGLHSGFSLHAIDAALIEVHGSGDDLRWRWIAWDSMPWPSEALEVFDRVLGPDGTDLESLCCLDSLAAECFARAAERIARKADVPLGSVDCLGFEPQLLRRLSEPVRIGGFEVTGTLRMGDPAVVAGRAGRPVLSGFRVGSDSARLRGLTGPSWVDRVLFGDAEEGRIVLHLGGIACLTAFAPDAGPEASISFDTGPGTVLADRIARQVSGGLHRWDPDGGMAARGTADDSLVEECLHDPWFEKSPPKSVGGEWLGPEFLDWFLARGRTLSFDDLVATATEISARSIEKGIREHVLEEAEFSRLILAGGGIRNRTLVGRLRNLLPELVVESSERYGVPPEAEEAISCALLANEAIVGLSGAGRGGPAGGGPGILGAWTPGDSP